MPPLFLRGGMYIAPDAYTVSGGVPGVLPQHETSYFFNPKRREII